MRDDTADSKGLVDGGGEVSWLEIRNIRKAK